MKIVLRIFGTIALLVALLFSGGSAWRNFRDAGDAAAFETEVVAKKAEIEKLRKDLEAMPEGDGKTYIQEQITAGEAIINEIPSSTHFTMSGLMMVLLFVVSLIAGILLYKPRPLATVIFLATIAVSLLAYLVAPDMKETMTGGAANKTLAIASAVPAILCGLFAFLIAKKSDVKA